MKKNISGLIFAGCLASGAMFGQTHKGSAEDLKAAAVTAFNFPAEFQPNRGQAPAAFDFMAQGFGYTLGISASRAQLAGAKSRRQGPCARRVQVNRPDGGGFRPGAKRQRFGFAL